MNLDSTPHTAPCNRHRTTLLARLLTVVAVVSFSLGAASTASGAGAPPTFAKSYTGTARNVTAAASGAISLSGVTESGGKIAGTFGFHAPLAGSGPFTGTASATTIQFTVAPTGASCGVCKSIIFTGTVSPLVSFSGTWVAHLRSGATQHGAWGVGSTWNGTYTAVGGTSGTLAFAEVTENANGTVTGAAVFNNAAEGPCSFAGSVHGSVLKLKCYGGEGEFQTFTGTVDPRTGYMGGSWTVSYAASHGAWQLHRSGATGTAV
jgi:hypothetical protein